MPLTQQVRAAFAADGALARATSYFVPRQQQTDMALAVAAAIEGSYALVVEASTGVGKTYAYLVPALLSGERVLLSTATKALQDQLFSRDLPRLAQALGVPVRMALLKGRGSYLCLHRMALARYEAPPHDSRWARTLADIEQWSHSTLSGDLAEVEGLDEHSPLMPWVSSTRENCLGSHCPQFRACHVNLARRQALAANVVVVNHHLFFADLAVRESGMAELLPSMRIVIFDEAHQLNETGVQFLGAHLRAGQLLDLARDILAAGLQLARGLLDWQAVVGALEHAVRDWRLAVGKHPPGSKLRWMDAAPEGLDSTVWTPALQAVHTHCLAAATALDTVSEIAPDFVRLHERALALAGRAQGFLQPGPPEVVRWLDVSGTQLQLMQSPLDIAQTVQSKLLGRPTDTAQPDHAADAADAAKSWVFTSATLGDDAALSWFTQPCGLTGAQILKFDSPFNYPEQAALYIPTHWPAASDPTHSQQLAESVARWARCLGGRTLVLTTTLRALRLVGDGLQTLLAGPEGLEVLVQGSMTKRALLARFRSGDVQGRGCVLVASASFWEGIDVPGEALQLVVIDKLPFAPPQDPLTEARAKRLAAAGRSAFKDYFLPEAAVALKQGAGRLIRQETDRGVLVIGDRRLMSMSYGKRLRQALPPMRLLRSEGELLAQLQTLREMPAGYAPTKAEAAS